MAFRKPVLGYRIRLVLTYGVDWLIATGMAAFVRLFLQQDRFQNIPDFDMTDTSIQYAFKEKQVVPDSKLTVFLILPYIQIIIGSFIFARKQWWDLHMALLGLTVTFSLAGGLAGAVRTTVGRPRPDFIARCNPREDAVNGRFFGLVKPADVCQTDITTHLIVDGMRSFFSGHAILLAAGFGFASLYWAGKMHIYNRKAYTAKLWTLCIPATFTGWVCLTRITDRRHHWEDVSLGLVLGIFIALFIYPQFYPPLSDAQCHLPYPPRIAPKVATTGLDDVERYPRQHSQQGPVPRSPFSRPWYPMTEDDDHSTARDRSSSVYPSRSGPVDIEATGLIATPFNPDDHLYDASSSDHHDQHTFESSTDSYHLHQIAR